MSLCIIFEDEFGVILRLMEVFEDWLSQRSIVVIIKAIMRSSLKRNDDGLVVKRIEWKEWISLIVMNFKCWSEVWKLDVILDWSYWGFCWNSQWDCDFELRWNKNVNEVILKYNWHVDEKQKKYQWQFSLENVWLKSVLKKLWDFVILK